MDNLFRQSAISYPNGKPAFSTANDGVASGTGHDFAYVYDSSGVLMASFNPNQGAQFFVQPTFNTNILVTSPEGGTEAQVLFSGTDWNSYAICGVRDGQAYFQYGGDAPAFRIEERGGILGNVDADSYISNGNKVVGDRQLAVADATGAGDIVARFNELLVRLRAHGLIYT